MSVSFANLTSDQKVAVQSIVNQAKALGVNVRLALATAWKESSFNTRAVGDNGTSFGLFQLHRGGQLGNLSPQQAFDPNINAKTALSSFASMQSKYSDPGTLAAKSQRPANPLAYASAVNSLYSDPNFLPDVPEANSTGGNVTTEATTTAFGMDFGSIGVLTKSSTWIRVLEVVVGAILIIAGIALSTVKEIL